MKTPEFNSAKASMAAARKAHFEAKGTVGMWRGRAATFQDRKHVANKKACRGCLSQEG
jgi:hypothetical protein